MFKHIARYGENVYVKQKYAFMKVTKCDIEAFYVSTFFGDGLLLQREPASR